MVDIWTGEILLPEGKAIKDVGLASQIVASGPTIPASPLHFLSTVNTARIPLYLAAGPSLDVWTTSERTEEWFRSILVSKVSSDEDTTSRDAAHPWWNFARAQSPIGILVQVKAPESDDQAQRITELLFYGTIAAPAAQETFPTPPSSSPDHSSEEYMSLPELRVHAIPLSSKLIHSIPQAHLPFRPIQGVVEGALDTDAQFLPTTSTPATTSDTSKRKRDLFEEATQLKKVRRKGGEGVSAAAAKASDSQPGYTHRKSLSVDTKPILAPDSRASSIGATNSRPPSRQLSRSPSISSEARPLSRKGPGDHAARRSGLSTVETASLQTEEKTVEIRNKEALSKVVMAAMRMHGLQQRTKNKSTRASVVPSLLSGEEATAEALAEEASRDEEYKLIYHQTYKGAALALRKHITTEALHLQPDRLRDVVEKLLAIFCNDPLAQPLSIQDNTQVLATPGGKQNLALPHSTHSQASPFDVPSCIKGSGVNVMLRRDAASGSPVSRRKEGEVSHGII